MILFYRLFGLILNVPVNDFSVMSGRVLLGCISTKQLIKGLAQGHNTVTLPAVRLEPYCFSKRTDGTGLQINVRN